MFGVKSRAGFLTEKFSLASIGNESLSFYFSNISKRGFMDIKKYGMLFIGIFFGMFLCLPVKPVNMSDVYRWLKYKIVSRPINKGVNEVPVEVPTVVHEPIQHSRRQVIFLNNMRELFDTLKDDPAYAELPNLIDSTVIVGGQALTPGSSMDIMIEDDMIVVTIKLYKGIAKLIHAMEQSALKGILISLLNRIEPWVQWQYSVRFRISKNIDAVQLSDLVLAAYNKALNEKGVNHRFKWILVVDLSLNETVDL